MMMKKVREPALRLKDVCNNLSSLGIIFRNVLSMRLSNLFLF